MDNYGKNVKGGTGGAWITLMRVLAWILFALCVIFGIGSGIAAGNETGNTALGIVLGIIIGLVAGFLSIAMIMVVLDIAQNIKQNATNTAAIYEKLSGGQSQPVEAKVEKRCPNCGAIYEDSPTFCIRCGTKL
ncbi:MAG: zinc ribbon domain-containing protein [Clostridia bacterium]|nr:zinc ribbon domain-containing protein [Clostridia bacterium]